MVLKTYKRPKNKQRKKKNKHWKLMLLKNLQMTKKETHKEIKQALEARCS
jgi:hypothetical protein